MSEFQMVYIVCSAESEAILIAENLVKERLVACANIFPSIQSFYWWEGKVQKGKEVALFLKSKSNHFEAIQKRVKELHSYEVPCIVALPIQNGEKNYLSWIEKESL